VYARTTTIDGEPSSIDAGIVQIRDTVMPMLEGLSGYIGLSLLVDRTSGRCIATSAWETEEAMRASDSVVHEARDSAAQTLGGIPEIAEWEIAVLHRDHQSGEGACVRVTWVKVDPDQVDRGIDIFKMSVMPALDDLDGHCSTSLLLDRASGRAVSSTAFDSAEALARNQSRIEELKAASTTDASADILDERDFELAIAHLRVPEMV